MIRIMETTGIVPGEPGYSPAKRARWLEARRGLLCGSDTSVLFGLGINTHGDIIRTPMDVWLDKMGLSAQDEIEDNGPAYHGIRLESYVADEFSKKSGIGVLEDHWLVADDEYPTIGGDVDYYTLDAGVLECTTTRAQMQEQWPDGPYFRRKHIQLQQYLHIANMEHGYLACLFGGQRIELAHVERDDAAWNMIVEACADFWPHVETGTPPEMWPETPVRSVALAYPIGDGDKGTVVLPGEATVWIEQYEQAKRRIARLSQVQKIADGKRTQAEAQLIRLLGGKRIGAIETPDGYRRVEQKMIEVKAYPVAASSYPKLTVKDIKPKR